ncbi:DUF3597 domain-containing protein [Roseomonas indoligenes]|uniref:DUF3597 domain-containing protein n=1 Tax=Roseomonas indoligenes TaxID=2820811 RepID=A0A940MZE0_9PROT|nr:DUF3597 domain-containing protein [Pararoseomonas indoligenes]MBP0493261.1 DUF3597 domain-containing protein [Pararoseomonas indoligenes]
MSMFRDIMGKIFGHPAAAQPAPGGIGTLPDASASSASPASGTTAPSTAGAASGTPAQAVDVEAVLTDMASKNSQKLNWQSSIVDLMKLLNLDSGLESRKELAHELGYSGSTDDSASMNIWLHKQVMQKLAENGGKVPDSLKG